MEHTPDTEVNGESSTEFAPLHNWPAILDEVEMMHPVLRILLRYRELIRIAIHGAGGYSLLTGLNTYIAGDLRFDGPSYATAVDLAQAVGLPPAALWGVSVFAFGVLTLVPVRKVSMCGLFAVAAWSSFMAGSHLISANYQPLAGISGIYAHAFIALVMTGLFIVRMIDRRI